MELLAKLDIADRSAAYPDRLSGANSKASLLPGL